jgi:hypothetical protein
MGMDWGTGGLSSNSGWAPKDRSVYGRRKPKKPKWPFAVLIVTAIITWVVVSYLT